MARVNVYLPDELAEAARAADLNVSAITQDALRAELAARHRRAWLDEVLGLPPTGIGHDTALHALDDAREDLGG
jgi:post-segregation antitoxin (ccd killing protein)